MRMAQKGQPAGAAREVETAAFRGDDAECMVAAGLSCRRCLSGEVDWVLALEPWDETARCRCRSCGHRREVSLTGEQALRLALARGERREHAPAMPHAGLAAIV